MQKRENSIVMSINMIRLQKVMADAGVDSRRHCEEMILAGKVKVNGKVVKKLPILVDPETDVIMVSGRRLRYEPRVYYLLNKPKKVVCTNSDPEGRRRAIDLLGKIKYRVYPVGRLDADSQGLLIMTNDGELANQLTHPRYGIAKTYIAEINSWVTEEDIGKLKKGIYLEDGKATFSGVKIVSRGPKKTILEITLREGRNRQIKRMLARLGHPVRQLTRTRIGKLTLKGLGPGHFRPLKPTEVNSLRRLVQPAGKSGHEPQNRSRKKTKSPSS